MPWRQLFARSVEVFAVGAMTVLLPISPLTCTVLSGRFKYLRQYRATFIQSSRYAKALKRTRVISRNLLRHLATPPDIAETIEGDCTHCGLCCVDRSCVFLEWTDNGQSRCSVYGNWFWKLTSCGDYPIDRESIAAYACPSFKAIPIKVVKTGSNQDDHLVRDRAAAESPAAASRRHGGNLIR